MRDQSMLTFVLILLLLAGLANFYFSLQILRRISQSSRETQVNFWELRWQVHKFMKRYRELTRHGTRPEQLIWYGYWITLIVMILGVVFLLAAAAPSAR